MQTQRYTLTTATRQEVDIAVAWAANEGWNPGLYDADCYFAVDDKGFLLGCLGGEPIATLSAVKYNDYFGFLGFYIVKPGYRGQGYGKQVWNAALDYLAGCNIGLDGVVEQQANYQKQGFKLAFRNIRYQGRGGGQPPRLDKIVDLSSLPFSMLAAYDRPFFPAPREAFLKAWINQPGCAALGIMDGGRLAAYGVLRQCRSGYKIGPLYADSRDLAEALFLALKAAANPGEPIYLDVPDANSAAINLAEHQAMAVVFETARMYTGPEPELPLDRLFGITSFEIG